MGRTWLDHGKNKITAIVLNTESCIPSLLEKTDVLVLHLDSKGSFLLARPMNILQFSLNDIVSSLFLHACWSLPLHFPNEVTAFFQGLQAIQLLYLHDPDFHL